MLKDPKQYANLADDPAHARTRDRFRKKMEAKLAEVRQRLGLKNSETAVVHSVPLGTFNSKAQSLGSSSGLLCPLSLKISNAPGHLFDESLKTIQRNNLIVPSSNN